MGFNACFSTKGNVYFEVFLCGRVEYSGLRCSNISKPLPGSPHGPQVGHGGLGALAGALVLLAVGIVQVGAQVLAGGGGRGGGEGGGLRVGVLASIQ